jgi:alpha-galactosidase
MEEFSFQLKVRGDNFNGHYTNGLSMANSESVKRCKVVEKDADKTVYEADNYRVTAFHVTEDGVTKCHTVFENTSKEDITIELLSSFCVDDIEADVLHRATSFWSAEGKLLSQKLTDLNMEPSWNKHGTRVEKFGTLGSMPVRKWFPFAVLENSKTSDFIGVQIYCASSWQIEVFRNDDPVTMCGGLADFDYGHWCKTIHAGESFTSPRAVVAKGKSLEEVCDKLVKAQNPRISEVDKDLPIIYNEYCTTWGNPTLENIEKICKSLQNTNVKYLVIDSGWYKQPDKYWWDTIGDWNESIELFPNGIKEMTDLIKSYGLIPGIWFEFEKAATLSHLYEQTEHLLKRFGEPITVEGQRFLDMRDEWCIDYLSEKVIEFLKKNGFGYIKVDYNDTIGVGCDGAESLGEGLRQSVLGTQKFFKKLSDEIPSLVIENCSSGGHRLEPSMMELVSQASFSDAHECRSIPVIAANLHRLIRPEQSQIWAVLRAADDVDRVNYILNSTFLGRMCLSGEIFDIGEESWDAVNKAITFYEEVRHIIKDGMTTVIDCECNDYNNLTGHQAVLRELGDEALLIVHTFEDGANPDIHKYLEGYKVVSTFGSELDGDFRGRSFYLQKSIRQ